MALSLRTAAASVLLLGRAGASASEICTSPAGGTIVEPFSVCSPDNKSCLPWMNGKCAGPGKCECGKNQCLMRGQCVDKGSCPSVTGGHCRLLGCDAWRNATCSATSIDMQGSECLCGPGTCPIKGECRPPGVCAKATDGKCNVLGCKAWRHANCSVQGLPGAAEHAKCVCGEGSCPINGECVPEGSCPRHAHHKCTLFKLFGLMPCKAGECSDDGYCTCKEGQCYLRGKCMDATAENMQLSREWGLEQGEGRVAQEDSMGFATAVGAFGAAATMELGFLMADRWRARAAASAEAYDYESLEG